MTWTMMDMCTILHYCTGNAPHRHRCADYSLYRYRIEFEGTLIGTQRRIPIRACRKHHGTGVGRASTVGHGSYAVDDTTAGYVALACVRHTLCARCARGATTWSRKTEDTPSS